MSRTIILLLILCIVQCARAQNCASYKDVPTCFRMSQTFARQVQSSPGSIKPGNVCIVCNKSPNMLKSRDDRQRTCRSCADMFRSNFWSECQSRDDCCDLVVQNTNHHEPCCSPFALQPFQLMSIVPNTNCGCCHTMVSCDCCGGHTTPEYTTPGHTPGQTPGHTPGHTPGDSSTSATLRELAGLVDELRISLRGSSLPPSSSSTLSSVSSQP